MMLESGCGVVRSGGMGVVLVLGNHFARGKDPLIQLAFYG